MTTLIPAPLNRTLRILGVMALMSGSVSNALATRDDVIEREILQATPSEILERSQLSYKADGGFTGVRSFSVIISCVNGKISTLKTIHDPRQRADGHLRQKGTMSTEEYLRLWDLLNRQGILETRDAAAPRIDIREEFTIQFEAQAGSIQNAFQVFGVNRPEASRYFAIKSLIDQSVQMKSFWQSATHLVSTK